MEKFTLELMVQNCCGALGRISGIFSRRGYSIDSLHFDETEARMVIASKGDAYMQTQLVRQLSKLYDIHEVKLIAHAG